MIGSEAGESRLRVLPFERLDATRQLALGEAIIEEVGRDVAPPTLRLYGWADESLILGVGQPASELDLAACQTHGIAVLRRISGGTAVLHDKETISFQLTLPTGHPFLSDDIHINYRRMAELIVDVLARLGIASSWTPLEAARADRAPQGLEPICFSSLAPYEITASGRKLVGLAQVRRGHVSALQGMVYRRFDPIKTVQLLPAGVRPRQDLASDLAERTTDLSSDADRSMIAEEFVTAFLIQAEAVFGKSLATERFTVGELERAAALEHTKYGNAEWTFRR